MPFAACFFEEVSFTFGVLRLDLAVESFFRSFVFDSAVFEFCGLGKVAFLSKTVDPFATVSVFSFVGGTCFSPIFVGCGFVPGAGLSIVFIGSAIAAFVFGSIGSNSIFLTESALMTELESFLLTESIACTIGACLTGFATSDFFVSHKGFIPRNSLFCIVAATHVAINPKTANPSIIGSTRPSRNFELLESALTR